MAMVTSKIYGPVYLTRTVYFQGPYISIMMAGVLYHIILSNLAGAVRPVLVKLSEIGNRFNNSIGVNRNETS